MKPGEIICRQGSITLNEGLETKVVRVLNTGSRPIQVGAHFHFFEANRFLVFERAQAYGFRLDIPSGCAVRFESGEEKEVRLVQIAGKRIVCGLNKLTDAQINDSSLDKSMFTARLRGFIAEGDKNVC
jgi:urease beta subunit